MRCWAFRVGTSGAQGWWRAEQPGTSVVVPAGLGLGRAVTAQGEALNAALPVDLQERLPGGGDIPADARQNSPGEESAEREAV